MVNGYGICFNEWIEDDNIKTELRLLIKISSLSADSGYCYAGNEYFSKYFNTSTVTISKQIKKLEQLNYIEIEYVMHGSMVKNRYLRLKKTLTGGLRKLNRAVKENFKDNSTSINTTSIIKPKEESLFSSNEKKTFKEFNEDDLFNEIKSVRSQFLNLNSSDLEDFLDYWIADTEVKGKVKPRIQHQPSWNIKSRLRTWSKNKSNFNK